MKEGMSTFSSLGICGRRDISTEQTFLWKDVNGSEERMDGNALILSYDNSEL